jgi:diguanylate cyclase (GGDEF)-like protein/PAS domain S-box-containing protein
MPNDQPASSIATPDIELPDTSILQLLALMERASASGTWSLALPALQPRLSPQLAALLELTLEAATGLQRLPDFFAPESRPMMQAALDACINRGTPFDLEAQALTARGNYLVVRSIGEPVRDASGAITQAHGVIQDITEKRRAEQESLSVTMRLSTTLASITEAFVTLDRQGRFTYLNTESEYMLRRKSVELLGKKIWQELDDSGSGRMRKDMEEALAKGLHLEFEDFYPSSGKWLALRAYPFEEGMAVYLRDVTALRQSQEQLLLLQTSISRLNDMVLITEASSIDAPGPRIVFVNDAFEKHTGYSRDEVLGKAPRMLQGPLTQRSELDRIRTALLQAQPVRAELINYKKNGDVYWIELEIVPVDYFNRGLTHWVAVARDITERKAAEDEIEHLAFYDTLTQLPNRQLLMDRLKMALSGDRGDAGNHHIGVLMFIDLDHFKVLNDSLGHARGDMLLQQVATRLASSVRSSDTVARLGGDEFVVMLEDVGVNAAVATETARIVGEKIRTALGAPYDLADHDYHGTCSIGITCFSHQKHSIGDLLKQADLAMYQAKAAGRNAVCFFDPEMQAAATANATLSSQLREALHDEQFVLHYQPQVGVDSRMLGVEALLRWQHPVRGLVGPDDFIPQAEESGLILPLGQWVMEKACAQLALWAHHVSTEKLSIAINVSARQFRHPEFVEGALKLVRQYGIPANRLKLELTESLLATGMEVTIAKMGLLKEAGVTLSIDDFGMGYSALSYLKYLPLDQLKIDRTFVKDVLTDPNDAAIARTIIGLAQSLGLGVIAEGVETESQRAFLAWHGCESYQGHLFCAALPIDELEIFMSTLPTPLARAAQSLQEDHEPG